MSKAVPIVLAVAVGVFAGFYKKCAKKGIDPDKVQFVPFERATFRVAIPDWKVASTSDRATGAHQVAVEHESVTIKWVPGTPRIESEVKEELEGLALMPHFKLIDEGSTEHDGNFQVHVLGKLTAKGATIYGYFSESQCTKTSVAVSIQVLTIQKDAATKLGKKIEQSLVCLGEERTEVAAALSPSSSLGEGWGFGAATLVQFVGHRDGRVGSIFQVPGDLLVNFKQEPKLMVEMMAARMESDLRMAGDYLTVRGLKAIEIGVAPAKSTGGPPASFGIVYCKNVETSFIIVIDGPPATLSQFGCPGAGASIADLPDGCEMGLADFCVEGENLDGEEANGVTEGNEPATDDTAGSADEPTE